MITAINIETEQWNRIIEILIRDQWNVVYKYDAFDAGIDFDLIVMHKGNDEILLGWDNWLEGEIKCSEEIMRYIEVMINSKFYIGDPVNLKPEVINLYWKSE
ncbi:hypothetical protein [Pseudochryseolinea flava]|uniref:Uncharacterized protein n=1 Tax=Pseudochryseolinea flava TaxID=2059302 RepID=A0A364XYS0_9BACT|nr:hypothetical protein [Pseudochryseolinea flava]RAV98943.1 hypothetical protein DQQ10_21850 [Pseudochryseolinea flava]